MRKKQAISAGYTIGCLVCVQSVDGKTTSTLWHCSLTGATRKAAASHLEYQLSKNRRLCPGCSGTKKNAFPRPAGCHIGQMESLEAAPTSTTRITWRCTQCQATSCASWTYYAQRTKQHKPTCVKCSSAAKKIASDERRAKQHRALVPGAVNARRMRNEMQKEVHWQPPELHLSRLMRGRRFDQLQEDDWCPDYVCRLLEGD